ncbi:hypothetical protein PENNAL_c0831G02630 [Penicillium nalgiovense]|uniref:Uncharacterized protein n=1 Tax=Penicillium nalgiovense TaxID=60175 RepID=A0A1V6U9Y4_PENNA|nr:hypothetical protein PENNAL_c0831G02630 [Penicillium nalgiovense]
MAGSKRNPLTNRGKQPTVVPKEDDKSHDEHNEEDKSSIRERLYKTPSKERFHELARDYKKLKDKI